MPRWNPTYTPEELQTEEWRPVVGRESDYEVSQLGRVRSWVYPTKKYGTRRRKIPKILAGFTSSAKNPYICVSLRQKKTLVHLLVLRAFVGPPPPSFEADHGDGDKSNPRLTNLEYVTKAENRRRAIALGLCATGERHYLNLRPEKRAMIRGENNGHCRFTVKDIKEMRRLRKLGVKNFEIAIRFNTTPDYSSGLIRGRKRKFDAPL